MALVLPTQVVCQVNYFDAVVFHPFLEHVNNLIVLCREPAQFKWLNIFLNNSIKVNHIQRIKQLSLDINSIHYNFDIKLL